MKCIAVTGAAGFIGSNFIKYFYPRHEDWRILCIDSLTYAGDTDSISDELKSERCRFFKTDICNRRDIFGIFESEKPDIVLNFAAESHVDRAIKNPELFVTTNVLGTQVLLDAAREFGAERFHQISTDEVYGDLPLERSDLKFTEESLLRPSGAYSASKASADLLALSYFRTFDLPVTVSRCSNNYGKYQYPEKLIPLMIQKALRSEPLPVYGDGKNIRDWIHVLDHCAAVERILFDGTPGEIYNVGAENERSNISMVKAILDYTDKPYSLIEHVEDRLGHDLRYAIDASKIRRELGWTAQIDFEKGFADTVKWYLDNPEWCARALAKINKLRLI